MAGTAVLALFLTGCGAADGENVTEQDAPSSDSVDVGNVNVYEFDLSDGTHCVLAKGWDDDVALTCNWRTS